VAVYAKLVVAARMNKVTSTRNSHSAPLLKRRRNEFFGGRGRDSKGRRKILNYLVSQLGSDDKRLAEWS
jgi:hypothetical protein